MGAKQKISEILANLDPDALGCAVQSSLHFTYRGIGWWGKVALERGKAFLMDLKQRTQEELSEMAPYAGFVGAVLEEVHIGLEMGNEEIEATLQEGDFTYLGRAFFQYLAKAEE